LAARITSAECHRVVVKKENPSVHGLAQIPSTAPRTGSLYRPRATIRATVVTGKRAQPLGCAPLISSSRENPLRYGAMR
jgi:hypothetical protein